ncbi:DUF4328 domain-containing protein [Flavobacterium sp.]|uniref:DUF4328 domain-containing protein n=1 Tax=Flavobacterium sp. TaxID=239 RepID=UPI003750A061
MKPNEQSAKTAIILIIIVMIFDVISLFSDSLEYGLLTSLEITTEAAESNDTRQQIIAIFYLVAYIISAVTFISWFRRAYYNLHSKVDNLDNSEAAAAYSWFIPFVNLYKPQNIMKEIFEETELFLEQNIEKYNSPINISKVQLWWTFWIVVNILSNIQFRMSLNADTIDELINSNIFSMVVTILSIPLAIVTINVIKEYSKIETLFFNTKLREITPVLESDLSNQVEG